MLNRYFDLAMEVVGAVRKAGQSLGYTSLKDEQLNALCAFVRGRDVFVSLPTGYGKSLCLVTCFSRWCLTAREL